MWSIKVNKSELRDFSKNRFKRIVKEKRTKIYALTYLLNVKAKHSKMKDLQYDELKMQSYLKNPGISVTEALNVFRFRTKSARFKAYMKSY